MHEVLPLTTTEFEDTLAVADGSVCCCAAVAQGRKSSAFLRFSCL